MNAAKLLIPVALILAAYFIFFASDMPGEIEFQGHVLDNKERVENNSLKEFDIYSYSDTSRNHLLLLVMSSTGESPSPQELLDFYIQGFEAQGFKFRSDDNRYLGTKGDEVIYMTLATRIDSAVAYIEKTAEAPNSVRGASDVFTELEGLSFDR